MKNGLRSPKQNNFNNTPPALRKMDLKIQKPAMLTIILVTVLLFIASAGILDQVDKHGFNHGKIDTLIAKKQSVAGQLGKLYAADLPPTEYQAEKMRVLGEQEAVLDSEINRLEAHHAVYAQMEKRGFVFLALALGCATEIFLNLRGKMSITLIVSRFVSVAMPFLQLLTRRVPAREV